MKQSLLSILLASTFLSTSAIAMTIEPTLDDSAISYSEGTSTDYNFTLKETDSVGALTTKYYKININKDKLSTSDNVSWTELDSKPSDMTNVVEVKLPNNQAKYFKYAYTTPSGYTTTSTKVNNTLSSSDVTDVVFNGIRSYGGAIYNTQNNSSVNIKADFIGNYVSDSSSAYGGAIFNHADSSNSTAQIGAITGDFIGNYAKTGSYSYAYGGAIYNYVSGSNSTAQIGAITGDFIGNYASSTGSSYNAFGGAIYNDAGSSNSTAKIGNIEGDFIGNYATSTGRYSYAYGGAIYNIAGGSNSTAQIGNIEGDFIGNYASSSYYAYGGAISNYAYNGTAEIGNIEGDFIGNYASDSSAYGGAIYNYAPSSNSTAQIGDITGDFIGNYASGSGSGTSSSKRYTRGGAIYNDGKAQIGAITGDFIGNYAKTTGSYNYAQGGAIYNYADSSGNTATIGAITGNFIGNYALTTRSYSNAYGGAIYNYANYGTAQIGDIIGDFIGNYADGYYAYAYGGAIRNYAYNSGSTAQIGNIEGDFIGNYAKSSSSNAYGGAIYNYTSSGTAQIGDITGDFIGNYASSTGTSSYAKGGAIYSTTDITLSAKANGSSVIKGNYVEDTNGKRAEAIYMDGASTTLTLKAENNGTIEVHDIIDGANGYDVKLTGDGTGSISVFNDINNADVAVEKVSVNMANGEVKDYSFNSLTVADGTNWNIDVDMVNETADNITSDSSSGTINIGKINNIGSTEETITVQVLKNGDGSDNLQLALGDNFKVLNENVEVENTVNYSDNYVREWGVVLATTDTTNDSIKIHQTSIYDGLMLINTKETSEERSYIFDIAGTQTLHESLLATTSGTLNIIGFNNEGDSSVIDANGYGLFDLSNATTLNIEGVTLANASGDAIKVSDQAELNLTNVLFENNGGNAISASGNVNINVKDTDIAMSENIVMENAELNLNVENGALNLSNEISGSAYNLNIQSGNVNINGNVSGVKDFRLGGKSVLGLGTSSRISVENLISGDITTFGMRSAQNATLEIDTEISNNQITNGVIDVSGDVSGSYNVIVNALSTEYASEKSIFLKAINDNSSTSSDFSVLRVKGSPYMWETILNANGETDGSNWYLAMKKANTTPEIVSGVGLQIAGIEQTRSVVRNVSGKVSNLSTYCPNCGIVPDAWDGKKLRNAWVSVEAKRSSMEKTVEMEAEIQGIESGIDIQKDMNNNLGMFVSYRNGEYELSGKGETYSSEIGSDMEIDSYLAGLYYRYDRNNSFLFASIYGGKQEANVKTEDGVANYTTEGLEFGAGAEIAHSYELSKSLSISPSLGLYYKQISYDEAEDNVGKSYEWEDIKHIEAELSVKITKRFENGKIYVKPSIIQTLTDGDKVTITNLEETETYKDQTLGRVEVGGNFNLNDKWSAYGWSHYTYGSGYDATAVGLGVSYNW